MVWFLNRRLSSCKGIEYETLEAHRRSCLKVQSIGLIQRKLTMKRVYNFYHCQYCARKHSWYPSYTLFQHLFLSRPLLDVLRHLLGHVFSTICLTTDSSSLNPGEVNTLSLELAIWRSWLVSTPDPMPKANTSTPLSLIPLDAWSKGVYALVVVCCPSVMTMAT